MKFFKELTVTYIQELDTFDPILHGEITTRTEGRPSIRMRSLEMCHTDRVYYTLELEETNLRYHSRLIEYDAKFSNEVMVITDEESDMSSEEIEAIISVRYQERKNVCRLMFREHLTTMKRIREEMRVTWERQRMSILIFTETNPVRTPGPHGSFTLSLPTPPELIWKE